MERLGKVSWVKKTEEMCLVHNNLCDYCRAVYTHSFLTLWNPMVHSLLGSNIYGILQARILECIAIFSTRVSSQPRDHTPVSCISCTAGGLFTRVIRDAPVIITQCFYFLHFFFFLGFMLVFLTEKKSDNLYLSCHNYFLYALHTFIFGLPRWLNGKESACQCRRHELNP